MSVYIMYTNKILIFFQYEYNCIRSIITSVLSYEQFLIYILYSIDIFIFLLIMTTKICRKYDNTKSEICSSNTRIQFYL